MGETAWRLISHLSLNYLSVIDSSESEGADTLRELLKLYVDSNDKSTLKQIDGIVSVRSLPVLRRIPSPNTITFARGLEITIVLDDIAFAGSGLFVLGMVLEQFFSRLVTINSFTETVIKSKQRGEVIRWPARTGRKQIL
jgi:type VI secretion system protein ImpG